MDTRDGHLSREFTPGNITVCIDPAFWGSVLGVELQAVMDEWTARGWVVRSGAPGSTEYLEVQQPAWNQISLAASADKDDDELRDLAAHQEVFARLLGIGGAALEIGTSSFIASPDNRFTLKVDQELGQPPSMWVQITGDVGNHPDVRWFLQRIQEDVEPSANTTEGQLRRLGEFRRAARALSAASSPVRVTFDEHLASFEIQEPDRVALRWSRRDGRFPDYSLEALGVTEGGEKSPLPLGGLSASEPLIRLGDKRFALIDSDTESILRKVKAEAQHKLERQALPLMADPTRVVPQGVSPDKIDLTEYGARVLGFVPIVRAVNPFDIQSSGVRWFQEESAQGPYLTLEVRSADPNQPSCALNFESRKEVEDFKQKLETELQKVEPAPFEFRGVRVLPTPALFHALETDLAVGAPADDTKKPGDEPEEKKPRPRLGVLLNEEKGLAPASGGESAVDWKALEAQLQPGIGLKEHQREGIEWLWSLFRNGKTGALLADEMGLGKTLQVACFLAMQRKLDDGGQKPALIVAPLLLLGNWERELEKFLVHGAYAPLRTLHGAGLKVLKSGDGALDVDELQRTNIVLTNYDTLDRYQVSLLKVNWRAVVLDEAQNIKNPDTFRSRAARALKRDFAICSTGTPVENRLLDLWTLFDFLSPLDPLGTQGQFRERFEPDGIPQPAKVATALEYPGPQTRVMRRTKDQVLDLQPKTHEIHRSPMTNEQMVLERRIVGAPGSQVAKNTLQILGQLRSLYQHPWLLRPSLFGSADANVPPDLEAICEASPKLRLCLEILSRIEVKGEKALVFSPWIKMQQLMAHALNLRFSLRPRIVNGEANQRSQSLRFIDEFSEAPGFNVLILSPLAAGAGLNIVAANHVIHYGRWWNPAKEDQATDRAYRIGQTRAVTVHYPILHHAGDPNAGFDVALHELVQRKRALARDFLSPEGDVTPEDIATVLNQGPKADA